MVKFIGKWKIEYPASCNGDNSNRIAFVSEHYSSDFVYLYGKGKIGISSGVKITNKKVISYLENLSLNLM